jgi:hypothetical protein
MQPSDFDQWREQYDALSYRQQQEFYNRLATDHPQQSHYSHSALTRFFEHWGSGSKVFELGGWDGEAARLILQQFGSIDTWDNYEICTVAPDVCTDPRYRRISGGCFPWERDLTWYDCWVLSHVVEHLSLEHLQALLSNGNPDYIYVDIPLSQDWSGATAAHKLATNAEGLDLVFRNYDFAMIQELHGKVDSSVRIYEAL